MTIWVKDALWSLQEPPSVALLMSLCLSCIPFWSLHNLSKSWCPSVNYDAAFKQEIITYHAVGQYMLFYGGHFEFQDGGWMKMIHSLKKCIRMSENTHIIETMMLQQCLQPEIRVQYILLWRPFWISRWRNSQNDPKFWEKDVLEYLMPKACVL